MTRQTHRYSHHCGHAHDPASASRHTPTTVTSWPWTRPAAPTPDPAARARPTSSTPRRGPNPPHAPPRGPNPPHDPPVARTHSQASPDNARPRQRRAETTRCRKTTGERSERLTQQGTECGPDGVRARDVRPERQRARQTAGRTTCGRDRPQDGWRACETAHRQDGAQARRRAAWTACGQDTPQAGQRTNGTAHKRDGRQAGQRAPPRKRRAETASVTGQRADGTGG